MKDKDWKRLIALLFGGWVVIWIYRSMLTPVYAEIQETIGMQSNAAIDVYKRQGYGYGIDRRNGPGD